MSFPRIWAIFLRQFFLHKGRKFRLIDIFFWPIFELLLWGVITLYLNQIAGAAINFVTLIIGVLILWQFLWRVQHGISISFLEDVWTRNFINLFSSPLSIHEYGAGLLLTSIFKSLLSVAAVALVAWILLAYNIFQFGFLLLPFVAILFLFGLAFGTVTTAIVLRYGPSAEFFVWSLPALLTPFSGVFYPISALPKAIQPISWILPPTYVFEGMRSVLFGGAFDGTGLLIGGVLAILYLAVAYWLLLRAYRLVLRKGLLTRFTTE